MIVYWVVALLLALFYLWAGGLKLVRSREGLAPMMGWVDTVPMPVVRGLGLVEVLGAVGLVVPPLVAVAPALALVAAVGLAVLQVLAGGLHLSRGEARDIWLNAVLLVLALAAAWLAPA